MSYLHEQALHKAVARLHILGHRDQSRQKQADNARAAGAGFGLALRDKFRTPTPKQAAAEAQMSPTEAAAQYGRYVQETGANVGMAQAGMPGVSGPEGSKGQAEAQYGRYVQGSYAPVGNMQSGLGIDESSSPTDFLKLNNSLSGLRLGGQFTPQGLDEASKLADANSNDRLYLKGMIHGAIDGQGPQDEVLTAPGMAGSQPGAF